MAKDIWFKFFFSTDPLNELLVNWFGLISSNGMDFNPLMLASRDGLKEITSEKYNNKNDAKKC